MTRRSDDRVIIDVRWEAGKWILVAGSGSVVRTYDMKVWAIDRAAMTANDLADMGRAAQVRIFNKNGRFSSERTYLHDPPTKG